MGSDSLSNQSNSGKTMHYEEIQKTKNRGDVSNTIPFPKAPYAMKKLDN